MKKIIPKSLIIILFLVVIIINESYIFAKTSNNDWSGLGTISFVIIFVIIVRFILRLVFKSIAFRNRSQFNNNFNNNNFQNNFINNMVNNENNIFGDNPEATSKEIAQMVKKEDPAFIEEDFLKYACEAFLDFQNKLPTEKFKNLDKFESELLNEHFEKFTEQISNNNVTIQKANLLDYKIEDGKELLIVGIKLDSNMQYRLTFSRDYIRENNEYLTITCPHCGAPNQTLLLGKCKYCRGNLVKEKGKWILNKVTGLNQTKIENNIIDNFNSFDNFFN